MRMFQLTYKTNTRKPKECLACGRRTHFGFHIDYRRHRVMRDFHNKWVCGFQCLQLLREKSSC